jgi:multiple sugar transport system ATP-binding protein
MTMGSRIAVMNAGVLQQIDTPQNLYDLPDKDFVAGFIGSPAMNFFDARLVERDGKVIVDTSDFALVIPDNRQSVYRPHLGKKVFFGIRPEDLHDPSFVPSGIQQALVDARVTVTELMGNEVVVYMETDHHEFLGRFDPRSSATVGTTMTAALNMDRIHIFDKQTELAIR